MVQSGSVHVLLLFKKGLFFRHNEDAIIGTLKSSHIWAFNAMLIMGLSKNFTFDFVRVLIF